MLSTRVRYPITNELLEPIVKGLDLKESDKVLAVGGSGDQAFAILEYAGEVLAVDNVPAQVVVMEQHARLIKRGQFEEFLYPKELEGISTLSRSLDQRDLYFSEGERLSRIRSKLHNISFEFGDVFDISERGGFNKIYLSNVLTFNVGSTTMKTDNFMRLSARLPKDSLIYAAAVNSMPDYLMSMLAVDEDLTSLARSYEDDSWDQVVYRKL